jgi:hypothetical protein
VEWCGHVDVSIQSADCYFIFYYFLGTGSFSNIIGGSSCRIRLKKGTRNSEFQIASKKQQRRGEGADGWAASLGRPVQAQFFTPPNQEGRELKEKNTIHRAQYVFSPSPQSNHLGPN